MRVFVTGATGFVGSAVVQDLLAAGHQVLGLARSDASAATLAATGAEVHRGDLEDLDSLRAGATQAEGVIHTGFVHDFTRFAEMCALDARVIAALGNALAGSNRPLVITSGTALVSPGQLAVETTRVGPHTHHPRAASEQAADAAQAIGVNTRVVRLSPSVHGAGDHGFVPLLINLAREKGCAGYIGEGQNQWSAVHRLDAARLYRLALERGETGARYHGVGEQAIAFRDIATAIGKGLDLPVTPQPPEHFGWFGGFAGLDCPASSELTQAQLGWKPEHPGLLADLDPAGSYFSA
ncbi:SDR family oxidoreductase [Cypionkella sp.]|uniref:SDR family oxidoreductase n=1 Tax=Cypionkella sp. TaxID=2811411 RepID=UPI0026286138|nr:SDR family oxidoreductase [Cypionkella sp.]MDB5667025.1 Nucleoside-diphosphate-sugar epimerase [Cypionkella sp.]